MKDNWRTIQAFEEAERLRPTPPEICRLLEGSTKVKRVGVISSPMQVSTKTFKQGFKRALKAMKSLQPITEGKMSKGGHNALDAMQTRPLSPQGRLSSENIQKSKDAIAEFEVGYSDHRTVIAIGAKVFVGGNPKIDAKVSGVAIYEHGLEYLVVWWKGSCRTSEWLKESEVTCDDEPSMKIGFAG